MCAGHGRGAIEICLSGKGPVVIKRLGNTGIDSHSRVEEDVMVGSCRINRLLLADELVLPASSQQSLQHALDRFSATCDRAGMKINTKNSEVL